MADKPAFDPKADYSIKPPYNPNAGVDAIDVPDANAQAKQQLLNNTPLGDQPKSPNDLITGLQATNRTIQSNPDLAKLAPAVAGQGAVGLLAKGAPLALNALAAGGGAAVGSVGQQLATTGKADPNEALKTGSDYATGQILGEGVVSPLVKWLGASKSLGAKMLNYASQKAGNAPVELSPKTNEIVDEIMQQSRLGGGTPPQAVRDLLTRVGPNPNLPAGAEPGPLTYDEARILQSNASGKLSPDEFAKVKGRMKSLLPQFAKSFAEDVQKTADAAGVGQQHAMGMAQYAQASARDRLLKATASTAGTGIAGYELLKRFGVIK